MTDKIITTLLTTGPHQTLPTTRLIRTYLSGHLIARTTSALYVWENPHYPQYYLPISSISPSYLIPTTPFPILDASNVHGSAQHAVLSVSDRSIDDVVIFTCGKLDGYVRVPFSAMDAWFEEDVQVYGEHPRSPFVRIDVLGSSRRVRVEVEGTLVAESRGCRFLYETGLGTRYYMPKTSVQMQYLKPSVTTTKCPYKGMANYYDVVIGGKVYKDLVWWYEYPTAESVGIAGMVCFYAEKCDVTVSDEEGFPAVEEPEVDGVEQNGDMEEERGRSKC
ncbi:duf427 domain protein [Rutstroemia sp. NJR-2017a WRK4]|nr:duf427 domain protein [Rutstroemia sp. NJR-2017a WRK4]